MTGPRITHLDDHAWNDVRAACVSRVARSRCVRSGSTLRPRSSRCGVELYEVMMGEPRSFPADEEAHVVLFEPASTLNTGDVQSEKFTVQKLDWI